MSSRRLNHVAAMPDLNHVGVASPLNEDPWKKHDNIPL